MIQFIVHDENDSVGVVTVEGLKTNDTVTGWVMDQDKLIDIKINQDIPIGHKLAIKKLKQAQFIPLLIGGGSAAMHVGDRFFAGDDACALMHDG